MKNIVLLGSTGSIGRQTLEVVRAAPDQFHILALCAGHDAAGLAAQAEAFSPSYVGVADKRAAMEVKNLLGDVQCLAGPDAASTLAALPEADVVVNAVSGFAGMRPLLAALCAGKAVALANKESIVCAHHLVWDALDRFGGRILPIDSEQSAIFQCLGADPEAKRASVRRLILTASGGPFRTYTTEQLRAVTPEMAMKHPTWRMGRKVTLDSATLFNKGLEIMEAAYLFKLPQVDVLIHPESVVHSLVEFMDGSVMAQLSRPDMRLAIAYALSYPEREALGFGGLDLAQQRRLTFEQPDHARFPAIDLAYTALREGEVLPVVYNAANEAAAEMFFAGEIGFTDIPKRVDYAMRHAPGGWARSVEDILEIDAAARARARKGRKH